MQPNDKKSQIVGGNRMSDTPRWYVVQTRARQVVRAELNLRNQDFVTYLPWWRVEKICQSKRVERIEPLFPNYLFVFLRRCNDNWHRIRSTRGVLRLVSFGDEPTPVADAVIAEIRHRTEAVDPQPALAPGERVIVENGCFRDLEAVFHAFDGAERVVLLLRMLQQEVRVTLPLASVRRA